MDWQHIIEVILKGTGWDKSELARRTETSPGTIGRLSNLKDQNTTYETGSVLMALYTVIKAGVKL